MAEMEKIRMTASEFLNLEETDSITELINGEVFMTAGASSTHQDAVLAIAMYLKLNAPHGKTQIAPMDVHFNEKNVMQPDIFWVAHTNDECVLVDGKYWEGAPDLTVEVLSFSTANRDYRVKYDVYEKHGVKEYWLVDSVSKQIKIFRQSAQSRQFELVGDYTADESFNTVILDKPIEVKSLLDYS